MHQTVDSFNYIIGFDVAKDHLDYCIQPGGHSGRMPNQRQTIRRFLQEALSLSASVLLVCEATGGYEAPLLETALALQLPIHRAEGRRVRLFALAQGLRAKTDALDAHSIATYARCSGSIRLYQPPAKEQQTLSALVARREDLLAMRLAEENRLLITHSRIVKASLVKMMALLKKQIKAIETEIATCIKQSPDLHHKSTLMQSLPGVGKVTAMTLLASMPELGSLNKAEAAALTGLAPYNQDSGKTNQRRRVAGGRFKARRCLYMAATVAIRYNPALKESFNRLTAKGKPYKVALTAIMRKIIVILNAILKSNKPWYGYQNT